MRSICLLITAAAVVSCTTSALQPAVRTTQAEQQFQQLLAGKVAQRPISCLPHYDANDMRVIDESTIAFRDGPARTYVTHMAGLCSHLGEPSYVMLTKQIGGSGLCRGDIARVVDSSGQFEVGSCVFGEFTPYVKPR